MVSLVAPAKGVDPALWSHFPEKALATPGLLKALATQGYTCYSCNGEWQFQPFEHLGVLAFTFEGGGVLGMGVEVIYVRVSGIDSFCRMAKALGFYTEFWDEPTSQADEPDDAW